MIETERLKQFNDKHRPDGDGSDRHDPDPATAGGTGGRGISASADALAAYLKSRGVTVVRIQDGRDGAKVIVLDGCPMNADHGKTGDTAIVWRPSGVIGFECKHNSCKPHKWPDVRQKIDPDHAKRRSSTSVPAEPEAWETPVPFGEIELPAFPIEAIPSRLTALSDYCVAVAESIQVPVDMPAMLGLAVGAAALAKRIEVHVQGDHVEPVNLFVAVTLPPAERKSAAFRAMTAPVSEYERDQAERLAEFVEQSRVKRAILEASLKNAQAQAAKATKPEDGGDAERRAMQLAAELARFEPVTTPRLIADDVTPERLATLLRDNGGRIAVMSPEGDVFDMMAGRYGKHGAPNLGVYLKGHAGDDIRVDRVSADRPSEYVHGPALTIGLAIQPDVLRGLMGKPGFRGRGLLARFLYSLPASMLGRRALSPESVRPEIARAYGDLIRRALELPPAQDGDGRPTPHIVRLSPTALENWLGFARPVESGLAPDGQLRSMGDWAGKVPGAVARIAGVYHGLVHAPGRNPGATPVDAETMLCAVAVGEYLIDHAKAAFAVMGGDPAIETARRLLAWIVDGQLRAFTRREAYRMFGSQLRTVADVDPALQLLADHGYVRPIAPAASGPGRKPSQRYEVSPQTH